MEEIDEVKLTEEEQEILNKLRRDNEEREKIPPSERIPITNPDKYSFPIGIDDEGNLFEDSSQRETN